MKGRTYLAKAFRPPFLIPTMTSNPWRDGYYQPAILTWLKIELVGKMAMQVGYGHRVADQPDVLRTNYCRQEVRATPWRLRPVLGPKA